MVPTDGPSEYDFYKLIIDVSPSLLNWFGRFLSAYRTNRSIIVRSVKVIRIFNVCIWAHNLFDVILGAYFRLSSFGDLLRGIDRERRHIRRRLVVII